MSDNLNINQSELQIEAPQPNRFSLKLGHFVYLLIAICGVFALYQAFFMVRLTAGMTAEKPVPKYYATIEIVNASGIPQISKSAIEFLNKNKSLDLEIFVTNAEKLEYRNLAKTLVISRSEDTELAREVAAAFGLDKSEVVYRPPFDKSTSPKVTVVLGEDIQQMLNPEKTNQES